MLKPIVKWVGGKRQLLKEIVPLVPVSPSVYVEPFVGGGALLFDIQPEKARINDSNKELINVYRVVRDHPYDLLELLRGHEAVNSKEHYYEVRALDREPSFVSLSNAERAARIIYLNKTGFNGMFRVNSQGQINVPYGRYKKPNIVNEKGILALSAYLKKDIDIQCGDYAETLKELEKGAFVYLDPPYMPVSATSTFTGYTESGFSYNEQVRLRNECIKLRAKGIDFLQSNSDCAIIRELYADFTIKTVQAKRAINSKGNGRGTVNEVLISG